MSSSPPIETKLQFISRNTREIKLRTEIVERVLQLIHEFDEFMVHLGRFGEVRNQGMKGRLLAVLRVANDLRRRGPSAECVCSCFHSSRHIYGNFLYNDVTAFSSRGVKLFFEGACYIIFSSFYPTKRLFLGLAFIPLS